MATLQHDSGVYLAPLLIDPHVLPSTFFRLSFLMKKTVKTRKEKRPTWRGRKIVVLCRARCEEKKSHLKCVNHEVSRRKNKLKLNLIRQEGKNYFENVGTRHRRGAAAQPEGSR